MDNFVYFTKKKAQMIYWLEDSFNSTISSKIVPIFTCSRKKINSTDPKAQSINNVAYLSCQPKP